MSETQIKFIAKSFAKTIIEKINVLGVNQAENESVTYRNLLLDMIEFWGLKNDALLKFDDMVGCVLFDK